jgi:lipopolysaccharide/colanic/teichoic acid biosynthesis glycosyltransferase
MYRNILKRLIDICISIFALIILSPLFCVVSLLIFLSMGKPIFYKQQRPGWNAKPFILLKFRTMNFSTDINNNLLPSAKRITRLGKLLRRTSIDELPELINIIKGDMSLIGPRPLLVKYLPFYSEEEKKRHAVRPGLTGLAQIKGRNAISWPEKFKYDVYYVNNLSFGLDIKIMLVTIIKVLKGEGVNSSSGDIVVPFDEYNKAKSAQ